MKKGKKTGGFSDAEVKAFPKPEPDISPAAKVEAKQTHEEQVAPLREKRNKRTRAGGSWKTIDGKLVPNPDDKKNQRVEELRKQGLIE